MKTMPCEEMTDTLGFTIVHTGKVLLKTINGLFASLTSEITFEQMGVLYFVSRSKDKEMIQQDIAEAMDKTKSAILRSIDILEKKGFVKRLSVPGDRRKNVIELTDSGKNIIKEMHKKFLEQDITLKKGLRKEEMNMCLSVLFKIQGKCNKKTNKLVEV
jgi:DNA-binding MarR family transcriptional regulator